jgi:hypothetical protein
MQNLLAKLSLLFPQLHNSPLLKVIRIIVPVDRDLGKKLADGVREDKTKVLRL